MKPFNLEAALRGEKVVTRDGREVSQLTKFDVEDCNRPVVGVVDDSIYKWSPKGEWSLAMELSDLDLFMHEEPELAIWKPSACCSFRWLETQETFPRRVLQQLYVNKLKPEYEWRAVPVVEE